MSEKTNPIGAGKRNVSASLSDALYRELKRLAKRSGVGISTYITCVLVEASESKKEFENARIVRLKASNLTSPKLNSTIPAGAEEADKQFQKLKSRVRAAKASER